MRKLAWVAVAVAILGCAREPVEPPVASRADYHPAPVPTSERTVEGSQLTPTGKFVALIGYVAAQAVQGLGHR